MRADRAGHGHPLHAAGPRSAAGAALAGPAGPCARPACGDRDPDRRCDAFRRGCALHLLSILRASMHRETPSPIDLPEPEMEEDGLGWTSAVIIVTALFLLATNAVSLRDWV